MQKNKSYISHQWKNKKILFHRYFSLPESLLWLPSMFQYKQTYPLSRKDKASSINTMENYHIEVTPYSQVPRKLHRFKPNLPKK